MRVLLLSLRRWLGRPPPGRRSFDDVLREACDQPLIALSARAFEHSLSQPPACGFDSNRGNGRTSGADRA